MLKRRSTGALESTAVLYLIKIDLIDGCLSSIDKLVSLSDKYKSISSLVGEVSSLVKLLGSLVVDEESQGTTRLEKLSNLKFNLLWACS